MPFARRGFTPIELLVVIAIIGILAAILPPALGVVSSSQVPVLYTPDHARSAGCYGHLFDGPGNPGPPA